MAYPVAPVTLPAGEPPGCCPPPSDCDGFVGGGTLDGVCPGGAYPVNVSVSGNIITFDGSPYGILASGPIGSSPAGWSALSPCPVTVIRSVSIVCVGGIPSGTVLLEDTDSCSCTWSLSVP